MPSNKLKTLNFLIFLHQKGRYLLRLQHLCSFLYLFFLLITSLFVTNSPIKECFYRYFPAHKPSKIKSFRTSLFNFVQNHSKRLFFSILDSQKPLFTRVSETPIELRFYLQIYFFFNSSSFFL